MALIDCPECCTQVSSAAPSCPKCGYPIAQAVGKALSKIAANREAEDSAEKQRGTDASRRRRNTIIGVAGFFLVVAVIGQCRRNVSEPLATVEPGSQSRGSVQGETRSSPPEQKVERGPTRAEYTRVCGDLVDTTAKLRKQFGEPTLGVQLGLMQVESMSCTDISSGFICDQRTTPMELRGAGPKTFRGIRAGFRRLEENAAGGYVDSGCCDGVAQAAKKYPPAKFHEWEGGCSISFGRVPPP